MKIVRCDNFGRETVADGLVAENIQSKTEAEIMLTALQATCTHSVTWYKLVEDDYKLWGGMAELV